MSKASQPERPRSTFYRPRDRKKYQYTGEMTDAYGVVTQAVDRTQQHFIRECDVNEIVKAFSPREWALRTAHAREAGRYVDLPDSVDFQEAMNTMIAADQAFESLPAQVRKRFDNDPAQFLAFFADPKNRDEAIEMGLIEKPAPAPAPQKVEVVNPAPAGGQAPQAPGAGGSPPAEAPKPA